MEINTKFTPFVAPTEPPSTDHHTTFAEIAVGDHFTQAMEMGKAPRFQKITSGTAVDWQGHNQTFGPDDLAIPSK